MRHVPGLYAPPSIETRCSPLQYIIVRLAHRTFPVLQVETRANTWCHVDSAARIIRTARTFWRMRDACVGFDIRHIWAVLSTKSTVLRSYSLALKRGRSNYPKSGHKLPQAAGLWSRISGLTPRVCVGCVKCVRRGSLTVRGERSCHFLRRPAVRLSFRRPLTSSEALSDRVRTNLSNRPQTRPRWMTTDQSNFAAG